MRDSYLDHLKSGIKQDTLNSLGNAPLNPVMVFPDSVLTKVEDKISQYDNKGYNSGLSHKTGCNNPYAHSTKSSQDTSCSGADLMKGLRLSPVSG